MAADASDSTVVMRGKSRHLWVFPEELEMESLTLPTIVGWVAASTSLGMTES
jgi:hypothetical protein